jgi:tetratricopeptide (TPR) repeat protein
MQRAIELAPENADVLNAAGVLAYGLGRLDKAIALYRQAVAQDPLRAAGYNNLGAALDASDRLAEAEAAYRQALEFAPQASGWRTHLALNLRAQGRCDEALAEASRDPHELLRLAAIAIIEHTRGRRAESDAAVHELIAKYHTDCAYQAAEVYAARGEADLAFNWLERAYVLLDNGLAEMKNSRALRSLYADPRWKPFLQKMGLAD